MSETVFILGAGASREAGAPLMNDFLQAARDLVKQGSVGRARESFDIVEEACRKLRVAQSNAIINLNNLESVFAALEMAELIHTLDDWGETEVRRLSGAIKDVIVGTLGETIMFPINTTNGTLAPCQPYGAFANLIRQIRKRQGNGGVAPVSVITFNYDICLDDALMHAGVEYDYCLGNTPRSSDSLRLLKLHGSLNWGRCTDCQPNTMSFWDVSKFVPGIRFNADEVQDMGSKGFPLARMLEKPPKYICGHSANTLRDPFLVPPTYNKRQFHSAIAPVWQAAAAELREAEYVYVCGFSLPPTDQFFRDFYALGTIGGPFLRKFSVFDPDQSGGVENRFRGLLGQSTQHAFDCKPMTFSQAVDHLQLELEGITKNFIW